MRQEVRNHCVLLTGLPNRAPTCLHPPGGEVQRLPEPRLPSEAQEGHFLDTLRAVQEEGGALRISRTQGTAVMICLLGP